MKGKLESLKSIEMEDQMINTDYVMISGMIYVFICIFTNGQYRVCVDY